jgi:NADH:ubiquinone oxidoreductase subunit
MIGGHESLVREVGMDQYGNKYFEDWDVATKNQRRWVEYKDYFLRIGINGDRTPPGW